MSMMENAHALVIGIANYQNINNLSYPAIKDAQDLYDLLIDPQYCGYRSENVQLLKDNQATQALLRQALADAANRSNLDSTVLVYISSHGGRIESGTHAGEYLLPVDVDYTSEVSLAQTAISGAEFKEALRLIPARKVVVMFDCCHAGGIGQPKDEKGSDFKTGLPESYYETLQAGRGRVILASSRSTELSSILPGAENSFTHHLLTGLQGGAPGAGGVIRIFDLFYYVQAKVMVDAPQQHPIFKAELEENFPVTLYLGGKAPTPAAPLADQFAYDIFISYRHQQPDKTWVRKTLLPQLEAQGVRACIDYRDFRLGAPLVKEMERAVEQSRYTLSVLSPVYLTSNFTELENVLAEHLGLEQSQRRLLAVLYQPCRPRLGIRARLMLDMTDEDEFEINLARLAYELRQIPDA